MTQECSVSNIFMRD